jgi:hypothetical protein
MSKKWFKNLVRGVVGYAIPYVAPGLADSLSQLTGITSLTGNAGQALVGAGLGAGVAQATGGDWRKGAAIGGGLTLAQQQFPELYGRPGQAVRGLFGGAAGAPGTAAGVADFPERMYGAAGGLTGGGTDVAGVADFPERMYGAAGGLAGGGGTTGAGGAFMAGVRQIPSTIAARFSNPEMLADMTLRAAGMLAGSALAGSGLSPEEERLLAEQTAELRQLQQTNQQLFQQRLQQAQDLAGEAKYFDPTYFGLQSARRTQTAMGRQAAAGIRSLATRPGGASPERIAAERRRAGLDIARATGTAFDTGFGQGVQGQMQARRAGISAMPTEAPSSMGGYTQLAQQYSNAANRQRQAQADIGGLFADLGSKDREENRPKT